MAPSRGRPRRQKPRGCGPTGEYRENGKRREVKEGDVSIEFDSDGDVFSINLVTGEVYDEERTYELLNSCREKKRQEGQIRESEKVTEMRQKCGKNKKK